MLFMNKDDFVKTKKQRIKKASDIFERRDTPRSETLEEVKLITNYFV